MNVFNAGRRWLTQSVLLGAAVFGAACSSDTLIDPSRSQTVPVYGSGGPIDSANAISLATDSELRQNDKLVDLTGCEKLNVGEGHTLATRMFARGVQIYRWNGTAWALVAPDAKLYSNENARGVIGTHYAGPTWETNSGSKVVGAVVERCTRDPNDVQWLLLRAVSNAGSGLLHGVTYIQRVNTSGGVAPSAPGTVVGEEARMPYTTDYIFYRAK